MKRQPGKIRMIDLASCVWRSFLLVVDVYRGLLLSGVFKGFQCSKLFGDVCFSILSSVVRFKCRKRQVLSAFIPHFFW